MEKCTNGGEQVTCDKCSENYCLMNKWREKYDRLLEAVTPLVEKVAEVVKDWNEDLGVHEKLKHPFTKLVETAAKELEEAKK